MRTIVSAAQLVGADSILEQPFVVMEDGRIAEVGSLAARELPAGEHRAYAGATLAAPLLDVHVHGCCGRDVMEGSTEALAAVGSFLARHGVGTYLPTTITAPEDGTLRSLSMLGERIGAAPATASEGAARPIGIHIEGPFLSAERKGAHPEHQLLAPSLKFFEQMWQASGGTLRLMTIAPELPGALEVIARAVELGVRVSIGHSNATYAQAAAAVALGACSATHTFNAMRPFEQREPGILGLVLTEPKLYAELIVDGIHVHPAAVRLFFQSKGSERGILITDAMAATGMPDGEYKLGELDVRVVAGRCLIGANTLAGSTLTLDRGVRNFAEYTGCGLAVALRLASRNPARMLGLEQTPLTAGAPADLLVLSPEGEVRDLWLGGVRAAPGA